MATGEQKRREDAEGGFTLVEMLVVVTIIGVLVAIALPLYLGYRQGANNRAAQSDLHGTVYAMEVCMVENGTYGAPGTVAHAASWQPCGTQAISVTHGTTISMTISATGQSWTATSVNGGKTYSYDSQAAGSIG